MNVIHYSGDTININQLFLRKAAKGKADLYYDIQSEAKLNKENIQVLMSDSSMVIDNLLIYEQWLPDYNNGRIVVKILALAPAYKLNNTDYQPFYWLKCLGVENIVRDCKVPYPGKEVATINLYDFFKRRLFVSEKLKQKVIH